MRYLIDTQILIWFQLNDSKLKPDIKNILTDATNTIFVSDVSLFEIVTKKKINKLPNLSASLDDLILVAKQDKFRFLPMSQSYIANYETLPFFDHHKDPFDRLIIATALMENLPIISADEKFKLYLPMIQLIEA